MFTSGELVTQESPDTKCDTHRPVRQWARRPALRVGVAVATLASISTPLAASAPQAPAVDLTVSSLEVTQSTQKTDNSIRLVARRSTTVRATLANIDGGSVAGVSGRLHVFRGGVEITPLAGVPAINEPFTAPAAPQRANESDTLNFELTGGAAAGLTASADVDVRVDVSPVAGETNTANNTLTVQNLTVAANTTPSIFYTRINFTPVGLPADSLLQAPVGDAFVRGIWAVNDNDTNLNRQGLYPSLTYTQDDGDNIIEWPATTEGTDLIALLSSCRQLIVDNGLGPAQTTFLYGWLKGNPTDHNGLSNASKIGYGNTDPVRFQRTFAHELGHMIGHPDVAPAIDQVGWDVGARLPSNPGANNVSGRVKPTTLFDIMQPGLVSTQAWISTTRYISVGADSDLGNGPDASPDQVRKRMLRRVLVVQGEVTRDGRRLRRLEPAFRFPWLSEPSRPDRRGRYTLLIQPERGNPLTFRFDAFNLDDRSRKAPLRGFFEIMAPLQGEVRSIAIRDRTTGKTLIKRSRSPRPPRVEILSPAPKSRLGRRTRISWRVTDPDTPSSLLQYQIAYSPNGGASFVPIAVDLRATSFTFDSTQIQKSPGRGVIRVFASDGLNTAFDDVTGLTPTAARY